MMKLLAFVAVFATLAYLTTAQDEKTCPDELRAAADNVVDVCGPVLKCNRKGQGRGRHEFKSAPADRRRRQDSEQGSERSAKIQECLEKVQGESAFNEFVENCPEEEKRLFCILRQFKEECPDYKPPNEEAA